MEKLLASYEQCIALKELGFRERVNYYFEDGVLRIYTNVTGWDFNVSFTTCISRPTKAQVFEFFRDKYSIQGYVSSTTVRGNKEGKKFSDYCWTINGIDMGFIRTDARDMEDVTFEKAETACIDTLLEIVRLNKHQVV